MTLMRYGILVAFLAVLTIPVLQLTHAQSNAPMVLATDNNSMRVSIDWKPEEIEPEQNVDIILGFRHPFADSDLSHVNYDLVILDESGSAVESVSGLHTHNGVDTQTVSFDNTGNFKIRVTVLGTGLSPPFDSSRSGTVETAIVVVPEFPVAPLVLAAAAGIAIAGARWKARR
jgi:hypothetical protein